MMNQRGLITLDFIFAITISFGMAAILFAMTFTLTVVEVAQYITFSAARAQAAAAGNPDEQADAARLKYELLTNHPALISLFRNGWFEISNRSNLEVKGGGSLGTFRDDYAGGDRRVFMGVRAKFTARVLNLNLPLVGSTSESDEGFTTRIASILIREPSQKECQDFMAARFELINKLDSNRYQGFSSKQNYTPMEDNGC